MTTNYAPNRHQIPNYPNEYDRPAQYAAHAPAATAPKSTSWILGGTVAVLGLAVLGLGGGWAFSAQGQPIPTPVAQPVGIVAAAPAQGLPAAALPAPASAASQAPIYVGGSPNSEGAPQVDQPAPAPNAVTVPGPAAIPAATGGPGVIIVKVDDPTTTPPQPAPPESEPPASEPPASEPPASEAPIVRDHRADCVPRTGVICVGAQQPVPPRPTPSQPLPPYNPTPAPPSTCTIFNTCPAPTGPIVRDHRN